MFPEEIKVKPARDAFYTFHVQKDKQVQETREKLKSYDEYWQRVQEWRTRAGNAERVSKTAFDTYRIIHSHL